MSRDASFHQLQDPCRKNIDIFIRYNFEPPQELNLSSPIRSCNSLNDAVTKNNKLNPAVFKHHRPIEIGSIFSY